jgi:hypothetical protein
LKIATSKEIGAAGTVIAPAGRTKSFRNSTRHSVLDLDEPRAIPATDGAIEKEKSMQVIKYPTERFHDENRQQKRPN